MEKTKKIALIERSLGIRHKLRVYDSMKAPDTHEELAVTLLAKWELEDELASIEEVLAQIRQEGIATRKTRLLTLEKEDQTPGLVRGSTLKTASTPVKLRK